ncbi:hypothetical protein PMAYCL1PPCAC_21624, partial [Pristionchus mayeri]
PPLPENGMPSGFTRKELEEKTVQGQTRLFCPEYIYYVKFEVDGPSLLWQGGFICNITTKQLSIDPAEGLDGLTRMPIQATCISGVLEDVCAAFLSNGVESSQVYSPRPENELCP